MDFVIKMYNQIVLKKIIIETSGAILLINGKVDIIPKITGIWEKDNNWNILLILMSLYSLSLIISLSEVSPILFLFAKNETPRK